ncbi:MAG: sigma-54 dependent transcriptional regulator [Candidatus Lernaella stagnicola]|nr:sigma-54 dependent transcriptional regulator [Candidatus Lernaella stagnicola]
MSDAKRILVIDDEEGLRFTLSVLLKKKGYEVSTAENGRMALDSLPTLKPDYVLCDLRMPELDGLEFLQKAIEQGFHKPIIMMSAYGTIEDAVEAMRLGAFDYISKPFRKNEVLVVLERAEEREQLRSENVQLRAAARAAADREFLTDDGRVQELLAIVRKIASFKTTVLITGESGTGKELIARSIHRNGPRNAGPFVAINCGAIPEHLLESELFGHAKGSFTDAVADKEGLVTASSRGTLFLDEIGDLPLMLQVKLLRVLQEEAVRPVGANREVSVDLRVVAATARDLEKDVRDGRFREDLYYRLNVFHLCVPPLRERPTDVDLLARHFITKIAQQHGLPTCEIGDGALEILQRYDWPGNVRELENAMERAVLLAGGRPITPPDLPDRLRTRAGSELPHATGDLSVKRNMREIERRLIEEALARTHGNKSQAAKLLDLSLRALLYKIKDYGLDRKGENLENSGREG